MKSNFALHIIDWDGANIHSATQTSLDHPSVLELGAKDVRFANEPFVEGSGVQDVKNELAIWQRSPHAHTSRAVFSALCGAVRNGQNSAVGGPVQLVGMYRIGNGRIFGVVNAGVVTVLGLPVQSICNPGLEYRNELFERVAFDRI
jgi:hypothetical protein